MLTPAMALSKAIGREHAASVMYRPLPQREGLTEEVANQFSRAVLSAQRTGIPPASRTTATVAENAAPNIRIRKLYVANPTMRDAMVKALQS